MEFEKGRPRGVERIKEIDAVIVENKISGPDRNKIIEEKRSILINLTDQEIQEYLDYIMKVLNNTRSRKEVESDIRGLINDLKETK